MALCRGKTIFQTLLGIYKQHTPISYFSTSHVLSNIYKDRVPSEQNSEKLDTLCADDKPLEKKDRIPARSEVTTAVTYDPIVQKFINILMRQGRKDSTREIVEKVILMKQGRKDSTREIVEKTFENIKMKQIENYHKAPSEAEKAMIVTDPLKIFHGAVENCKPLLTLKSVQRGGSRYRIPVYIHERRQLRVGMNFIIKTADTRRRRVPLSTVLASEILLAYDNEGNAVKKKQQLHKECEAQRAFAHYRWN